MVSRRPEVREVPQPSFLNTEVKASTMPPQVLGAAWRPPPAR